MKYDLKTLPSRWCIKITEENREYLSSKRVYQLTNYALNGYLTNNLLNSYPCSWKFKRVVTPQLPELTLEQFKEWVVGEKPEFVLPEKWYMKVTNDILKEVNHFRINIAKYKTGVSKEFPTRYTHIKSDGSANIITPRLIRDYEKITFEQFKKYVLKEEDKVEETLLEKAKRLYPIGTKFKCSHMPNMIFTIKSHDYHEECEWSPDYLNLLINESVPKCKTASVWDSKNGWAEILSKSEEKKIDSEILKEVLEKVSSFKEVLPKFKILSFKGIFTGDIIELQKDGNYRKARNNYNYSSTAMLKIPHCYTIHSVQNQDGNIFIIGDNVKSIISNSGRVGKIPAFKMNKAGDGILACTDIHSKGININKLEHVITEPISILPISKSKSEKEVDKSEFEIISIKYRPELFNSKKIEYIYTNNGSNRFRFEERFIGLHWVLKGGIGANKIYIHSVKRLSDGKIFTVDDDISYGGTNFYREIYTEKLTKINLINNRIQFELDGKSNNTLLIQNAK